MRAPSLITPFVLLLLAGLFGCGHAELRPPPAPRSPAEAIAQTHISLQETADAVGRALDMKAISPMLAVEMEGKLLIAETHLTTARQLLTLGSMEGSGDQVEKVQALIIWVRDRLPKEEVKT